MNWQTIVNIVIIGVIVFLGLVVLVNIPDDSNQANQIVRDVVWDWITPYIIVIGILAIILGIGIFRFFNSGGN